jgi:hypothetical protein
MRSATVARLVLGTVCLAAPDRVLHVVGSPDARPVRIVRILGGRLVLQAGWDVALGARTRGVDVAVELTHAASMVLVAALRPARRRPALLSAAVATGIVALDLVEERRRPKQGAPRGCVSARRESARAVRLSP